MADSFTQIAIHYVFSTKNRQSLITPDIESRIWRFVGGVTKDNGMVPLAIGGMPDHLHALLSLPATLSVSDAIQLVKGKSSFGITADHLIESAFRWQSGYGAFSVSRSRIRQVKAYINNQKEHHRAMSFKEEYLGLLEAHGISYPGLFTKKFSRDQGEVKNAHETHLRALSKHF